MRQSTILLTLLSFSVFSQTPKVKYTQDEKVSTLLNRRLEENRLKQTSEGFRVQLHFGNDRDKAREVKSKFLNQHQDVSAYESYQQPNFRIRVGNFRTRLEAMKFLKSIKSDFPSAFVVADEIIFIPLNK
jgi:hypothetical protein